MVARPRTADDLRPRLAVFDACLQRWLGIDERGPFADFLRGVPGSGLPYLAVELDDQVVGCGGVLVPRSGIGVPLRRRSRLRWSGLPASGAGTPQGRA